MTADELARMQASGRSWDGHLALLPGAEQVRSAQIARWVRRGLARAERVVYCEERAAGDPGSVERILGSHGVDAEPLRASGQLEVLSVWEFAPVISDSRALDRALREGYRGIRTAAPSSTGISLLGEAACARMEDTLNELCATLPWSALCQYDQRSDTAAGMAMAATHHAGGIRAPLLATKPHAGGLALAGELDASNEELLAWTVHAAVSRRYEHMFRLDMQRVGFVGVAGWRGIVRGSAAFRRDGGVLQLSHTPSALRASLAILAELDSGAGIELTPAVSR
jgi:anti-anti-sigma regulatory factor